MPTSRARVTVLVAGHLVMVALFAGIVHRYQPDPTGLRFNELGILAGWTALTCLPIVVGLGARTWIGASAVAVMQAASPLLLLGTARDPEADLNFAAVLWIIPLPLVAGIVVMLDNRWARRQVPER